VGVTWAGSDKAVDRLEWAWQAASTRWRGGISRLDWDGGKN